MVGRLVHKADFERLLATRSRTRSAHFAVHHVAAGPLPPHKPVRAGGTAELSTGQADNLCAAVDDLPADAHWLGCLVPKRHARRAVTRSLLKRQMRAVFGDHANRLPAGVWMLRLHAGFPVAAFPAAASAALQAAARHELQALLTRVAGAPAAGAAA